MSTAQPHQSTAHQQELDAEWTYENSAIWIPHSGSPTDAPPVESMPFRVLQLLGDNFEITPLPDNLVVLVSNGTHVEATFSAQDRANVVAWLWRCEEKIAQRIEDHCPVVYGLPSAENVSKAFQDGPGRSIRTTKCMELEQLLGFPAYLPN